MLREVAGEFADHYGAMLEQADRAAEQAFTDGIEGRKPEVIRFDVVIVKLLEIGLITPPVGLNVFVNSSVVGPEVPLERICAGILRFLAMDVIVLVILAAFPAISLLLPNSMWQ